jgi:DNA replication and repair protein RecF
MPIERFTAKNFRCLRDIELQARPDFNLVYGSNASGKTSLLEALAYLGRGKSFRGAPLTSLVAHGEQEFVLFGEVREEGRVNKVGVRNSREGLEVRVNGDSDGGSAALASALPLQLIDPDVHNLVSGGPEQRRRFLDWIAFHVEHGYLDTWRRFRRTLKQRNAALKSGSSRDAIRSWDVEFLGLSARIDEIRRSALELSYDTLVERGELLLGHRLDFEYQGGWAKDRSLAEVLEEGLERDRQFGATQAGPHRGELKLIYDERQAKRLVSRGQQKLLACSMILGATETAQSALEKPLLLLLDDPAAELDKESLGRLMDQVVSLGAQIIATSLDPEALFFPSAPAMFHVEQGSLTQVSAGGPQA